MRAILDTPWQNRVTFVVQDNHSPAARKCLIHGREGYKLEEEFRKRETAPGRKKSPAVGFFGVAQSPR